MAGHWGVQSTCCLSQPAWLAVEEWLNAETKKKKTGKGAPGSPQQYLGALTKLAAGSVSTLTDKPPMGASWCEQSDKGAFLQDGLAQAELCVNSLLLFLLSSSYVVRNGLASRCVHVTYLTEEPILTSSSYIKKLKFFLKWPIMS